MLLIVVHAISTAKSTLGLSGGLPRCLPLCEINTDQLEVSYISHVTCNMERTILLAFQN
jgi:hypothetical protein